MQSQFDSLAQLLPATQALRSAILGAAKVLPVVVLVPAFGLRALPWGVRAGLALALGFSVAPALARPDTLPLGFAVALQALSGLPVAVSAAVVLWAASMAGGLVDEFRQAREVSALPVVDAGSSPTGALFGIVAAIAFLQTGGPGRVIGALTRDQAPVPELLTRVVHDLQSGVDVALALAIPFLVASVLFEVGAALVSRALGPSGLSGLWAPLRTLFILFCLAIGLERVLALVAVLASRAA